jgi:3-oxoacyl-[acyl-carrier protein] reductase
MTDLLDFSGKVVLVTGSSRGIGAAMIEAFGARGAQCVVNYINDSNGQNKMEAAAVASRLKEPLIVECDVTQPDKVEAMMAQISERFGGLDVLVNNSGIIRDRTMKKMTFDEFESVMRVNVTGTFNVTKAAAEILREGGRIINFASVAGQVGLFGQANYATSKAAIIGLTKVSARELAKRKITVNAIAPGFMDIGMSKDLPDANKQALSESVPLKRFGEGKEVVEPALFLASPMASYITGHVLNVNGGYYMG